MSKLKIETDGDASVFFVAINGGVLSVSAQDDVDRDIAKVAQRRVDAAMRSTYSPAMGEPLAFASSVAASVLGGKITTPIESGSGELEQALT